LDSSLTFDGPVADDPKLTDLKKLIAGMATALQLDTDGPWHADPFAFEAFKAGVLELLGSLKPPGNVKVPTGTTRVLGINDPEALGRAYARLELRRSAPTGGSNG